MTRSDGRNPVFSLMRRVLSLTWKGLSWAMAYLRCGSKNADRPFDAPAFHRYVGIDYSGAQTPVTGLNGLRIYVSEGGEDPWEALPTGRSLWTRKSVAHFLVELLGNDMPTSVETGDDAGSREVRKLAGSVPTLVGIDQGFSFPERYFERHGVAFNESGHKKNWRGLLDFFQSRWPLDEDHETVRGALEELKKMGNHDWLRLTETRAPGAKSVFQFVGAGVAHSTHAGIPWLRYIDRELNHERLDPKVHFWPFDGWEIPPGKSAIVEVYPVLGSRWFPKGARSGDQHDAYSVAKWMSQLDRSRRLKRALCPGLDKPEREKAEIEGWILGVCRWWQ